MAEPLTGSAGVRVEDPRIGRSRAIILPVAREHFFAHGYLGTNIDVVALDAGVSKRTVYNIFGGKEQLFRAVLSEAIDTADSFSRDLADAVGGGGDVAQDLRDVAVRLARAVLLGPIVPLRRLLIGEAERFPEIARDYYDRAPGRVVDALAARFAALAERGLLRVPHARRAAEHFAFLVMGAPLDRALFTPGPTPLLGVAEVDERALAGAEVFLRAYRP